jgi:SAM-dependent methyltransferase
MRSEDSRVITRGASCEDATPPRDPSARHADAAYSRRYYETLEPKAGGSRQSAEVIVPLALGLVKARSVVDVGCGVGSWLAVFREAGIEDVLGVDLENVERELLLIPAKDFLPYDLRRPLKIGRAFDLALCLEVAGNLLEEEADTLVDSLVGLAPVILFSAPIPFQGGANQHNLQWPQYWVAKFRERGFEVADALRPRVWDNPEVKWWFAQNIMLYVRADLLATNARLREAVARTCHSQLALVHPGQLQQRESMEDASLKKTLSLVPKLIVRSISARFRQR